METRALILGFKKAYTQQMITISKHLDLGKIYSLLKGDMLLMTELPVISSTPYFHFQSAPSTCPPHSCCLLQLRFNFPFLSLASAPAHIATVPHHQA